MQMRKGVQNSDLISRRGSCAGTRPTCTHFTYTKLTFYPSISKLNPPIFFSVIFRFTSFLCVLFLLFAARRLQRRSDVKQEADESKKAKEVHLMHKRKRVRLISTAFEEKHGIIIDISDGCQKLRGKMTIEDEIEFNTMRTNETRRETRVQIHKG